jgi:hypothetical protein
MNNSLNGSHFGTSSYLPTSATLDWGNYGSEDPRFASAAERIDAAFSNPNNVPLPWLKITATDDMVKTETGIRGLVTRIQEALQSTYIVGEFGVFGQDLHDAIEDFQLKKGLEVDGVIGPATYKALGISDKIATASKRKATNSSSSVVTSENAPIEWYRNPWYIAPIVVSLVAAGVLAFPYLRNRGV